MSDCNVEVKIYPDDPLMRRMKKHLLDPKQQEKGYRSAEVARGYEVYLANGGVGIGLGMQKNLFPYDLILNLLNTQPGVVWEHYIFASLEIVTMYDLEEVVKAGFDNPQRYILFINPPRLQSQPQLPHGHILSPARATIMV